MADRYHVIWDRETQGYEVRHVRLFLDAATYYREQRASVLGGLETRLETMPSLTEEQSGRIRRVIVDEIEGYAAACKAARSAPSCGPTWRKLC